jgi:hypothetical protein
MKAIWQDNKDFTNKVRWRMSIRYFQGLAKRSKESDPLYGNRYKDSL